MIDVSIVTFNSRSLLDALLAALSQESNLPGKLNLYFFDNNSSDGTVERLSELKDTHGANFAGFHIARSEKNLGFGRAHNANIAAGSSEFVLILNPDARPDPGSISTLVNTARTDGSAGAWEARQRPYEHPKTYDPVTLEVEWASAAALLVRRSAFAAIEGFEPRIFLYGEDVDLSWRLVDAGYRIRYVPSAVVEHSTYQSPYEEKPTQVLFGLLALLYLRTRFGGPLNVVKGLTIYAYCLVFHPIVRRQRRQALGNLLEYARNAFYFWRTGLRHRRRRFFGTEYSFHRLGAFYHVELPQESETLPLVSVLIRTLGNKCFIRGALATVQNQTYPNLEVVVVQDGPATLDEVLQEFSNLRINYVPLGDRQGRCVAGNRAMESANGEYFVFLDDDDLFYADHVEQLMVALQRSDNPRGVAYSYAFELPTEMSDARDRILREGRLRSVYAETFSYLDLLYYNYLPIHCVLFHRDLFEQCGGFDTRLDNLEDWNLWVRFAAVARPFVVVPKTTAIYRVPMSRRDAKQRADTMREYYRRAQKANASAVSPLTSRDFAEFAGKSASAMQILLMCRKLRHDKTADLARS